jgi:hypothetical protein
MIPNYVKGLKEFEHWQSYTHNPSSPVRTALAKTLENLACQLACDFRPWRQLNRPVGLVPTTDSVSVTK